MEAKKLHKLSIAEYLQIERDNQCKYEYHDGSIIALAGGSLNHGIICGNIYGEIRSQLKKKDKPCLPFNSEIKLHIHSQNSFVYPDTMVVCGQIETSDKHKHAVTNPVMIVEVLSKSTAHYDRGDKFFLYRQIEHLQEYILIEQDKVQVEIYTRKENLWKITRITDINQSIYLSSIDCSVSLAEIYANASL